MRVYIKWAIPIIAIALISYLTWGFTTKLRRKHATAERIQTLPNFNAQGIRKGRISQADFQNKPTVLIYFNPDCEHCQREADELRQHAAMLADAQILMLSSEPLPLLIPFVKAHQLTDLPNIQVAHIDQKVALETFGFASVPNVLIYHADGKLAKHFRGETSIEAIKRLL